MSELAGGNKKSVIKNYLYNMIYQVFLIIVPLITTPYVARILGEEGSGQFSFAYSIVTYFTLFAALGFGFYAQRLIASHSSDKHQLSIDFWEIIISRMIPFGITLAVYFALIFAGVYSDIYKQLMLIFSINVFAVAFDISFLLQGKEEFGKLVIRNILIKVLGLVAIFVFVKKKEDLWIYALINALSTILSNVAIWVFLPKMLEKVSIKELKVMKHLAPTIVLFLPTIATSVYTTLDKTLIGLITQDAVENGNYEYAERIVRMTLTVITALGAVLVPRNSQKFAEGKIDEVRDNIYKSTQFVFMLGVPITLGVVAIARNFSPWFLGEGYEKVPYLMMMLSPIVIIIGLSNVFGIQFLIPSGQDKKFTIAIVSGAVTNLLFNILLIYFLQSYGAAIATIIAESTVTIIMYLYMRNEIKLREIIRGSWKYLVAGTIMFVPCFFVGEILPPTIWATLIIIAMGVIVYMAAILILRDKFVFDILTRAKGMLKRKTANASEENNSAEQENKETDQA